jgi:hypothetical protein
VEIEFVGSSFSFVAVSAINKNISKYNQTCVQYNGHPWDLKNVAIMQRVV